MNYIPLSEKDEESMLKNFRREDILEPIPHILKEPLNIPEGKSELEVTAFLKELSQENKYSLISFAGAGAYDHFIPFVVQDIVSKSEFLTSYTPYQAEVSQGTLQAMFEYQTAIAELTGMEVANSSMYDGGSALAEALLMAARISNKSEFIIPKNIHPYYKKVAETYTRHTLTLKEVPYNPETGQIEYENLTIDNKTGGIVLQHPNFFGCLEEPEIVSDLCKEKNILFIYIFDPISLGILKSPGEYGADIAVAEGQCLGIPMSFGGPYLGIFASKEKYLRKMPGRMAGLTVDVEGKTAYAMVLQTREQHIRRDKATSNICTNQMLCALSALVYLSVIGKNGLKEVGEHIVYKSHKLFDLLTKISGVESKFNCTFFKEFAIKIPGTAEKFVHRMAEFGIIPGVPLSYFGHPENHLLVAVTEKRNAQEIFKYLKLTDELLH